MTKAARSKNTQNDYHCARSWHKQAASLLKTNALKTISTLLTNCKYFDLFKTVNWHFFFVCWKLHYLGCIRNVFFCRFLSGSVELANSKQKKHQLPSPRIPNCSEKIFELTIWCIKAILFPIISFLSKILPVCLNLLTDLGYSHYPSFWRNLIHTLFPKEIVWDFKENTTKQANRNM